MIYSISGLLRQVAPTYCVVEACGVGYQCSASTHTLSSLPGRGQEVTLLTHLWVKEDGMELFGFSTEQERRCFRMLIGVSGVGPKAALSILSSTSPEGLAMSIITGDEKALTVAPGIGKKIAQRVILELKDKLAKENAAVGLPAPAPAGAPGAAGPEGKLADAAAALGVLGYGPAEISAALRKLETDDMSVEDIIKAALRSMMK